MIRDLFLSILSPLVIEPLTADLGKRLSQVGAPAAVIQDVAACARTAGPALADRATNDWWWGISTAAGVTLGMTRAEDVIKQAAPVCAPAITAARAALSADRA